MAKRTPREWPLSGPAWRRTRQAVQVTALLSFLVLFVYATAQRPHRLWPDLFARLDPLPMLSSSLAGRVVLSGLAVAAITLALTLIFGRVWCGWLCPLGTVLGWLRWRRTSGQPAEAWRAAKYLVLFAILTAAILGNQTLLLLDPITLLNRTLASALWPALRYAVVESEAFLYQAPFLWGPLDAIHAGLIQPLFQEVQPVFAAMAPIALLFLAIVMLNGWAERFWCRYLCPLGGLLGLASKLSLLRRQVSTNCVECARCSRSCPTGTIDPEDGYRSDPSECIVCLDCLADCTRRSNSFRWQLPTWRVARWRDYDPTRRQALAAIGAAVAGVALTGVETATKRRPATMIRPPGAATTEFSALCIRCGACVRACPTQGLQPSLFEGGVQDLMTPRLVPRLGYCSFGCNACGQVCPTGAIPPLKLEEKQALPIGLARIDRDRCLPWAYSIPCVVCEEACPVADKAIAVEEVETPNGLGEVVRLQRPRVIQELCIGCGVCEHQCPMNGEAAVRVYAPTQVDGS